MKPLDYIIDGILAILALFFFTLLYFGYKQDSITATLVHTDAVTLVDEVRSKGYLDKDMYDDFLEKLSKTGLLYDISLKHRKTNIEPKYRLRTPEEIIESQEVQYSGSNVYNHFNITTAIPMVNDPISPGSLNTETNESIIAAAVNTPTSSSHTHTDACYIGHKHTTKPDNTFTHTHQHTSACTCYLSLASVFAVCADCGKTYLTSQVSWYWDTVSKTTRVGTNWSDDKCPYCSSKSVASSYVKRAYSYSCGYSIDIDGDGYTDNVGTSATYQYTMSSPQIYNNTDNGWGTSEYWSTNYTETRGCYTYHQHGYLPGYGKNSFFQYFNHGTANEAVNTVNLMNIYGVHSFCSIPKNYSFALYLYNGNLSAATDITALLQTDGTVLFKLNGVYGYGLSSYANFPSTLTEAQFTYWLSDVDHFQSFMVQYGGTIFSDFNNFKDAYCSYNYSSWVDICKETITGSWYLSCGQPVNDTALCSQVVTSIVATNPLQTVYVGDPIITTVTATYLDGSTKVIACTATGYDTSKTGTQTVTLTYSGLVDTAKTTGTKTCTITVTVIPKTKSCANGHTYSLNSDGSDPGCPYCKAWLKSLEITTPTVANITINRGTTLQGNGVTLLAIYMDGHEEYVTDTYVDNLDNKYIGNQDVTISYKGLSVTLKVTTKKNLTLCPVCGRYYELYPDDSDPGCPYCAAKTPIFSGTVYKYYEECYTDDIMKEIYDDGSGRYILFSGDYLKIEIKNSSRSIGGKLTAVLFKFLADGSIQTEYGGYIRQNG
jgi:hypothetical protein